MLDQTVQPVGYLIDLLAASSAAIARSEINIPGYERPLPFRLELRTLWAKQKSLEADLRRRIAEREGPGQLGLLWLIVGAGAVVTGIGGWIYKHYSDTKRVEMRTEVYQRMIDDGLSPEKAAGAVYGSGSEVGSILNKLILLSVLGAGAYVLLKLK